jgi:hypothetical protein
VVAAAVGSGRTLVLRAAIEQALRVAISAWFASTVMGLLDIGPITLAWGTPVATALVGWIGVVVVALGLGPPYERRIVVRDLWRGARAGFVATAPSILFNLLWPILTPGSVQNATVIGIAAGLLVLPFEFAFLAGGQREDILASQKLAQTAEARVLAAESQGETTGSESSVDLDAERAFRYRRARANAEAEVRRYLPANPRTAKRMINHFSLARAIAEERGLFHDTGLTYGHLSKWIGLSEQWPALGTALTTTPERMTDLEATTDLTELQKALDTLVPGTTATEEMLHRLGDNTPLGSVLPRLVRFEAPD